MNDEQRFDRTARTWLEDGPTRAPDRPVAAALAQITTTAQERDLRVPWRFTDMPMLRVAAAVIAIAVIGGGALFLLRGPDVPGVGVQPTTAPSPSPTPMRLEAYAAARNTICDRAVADTDPLKARFLDTFDGSLTAAQRADWVAALDAFHARYLLMIDDLAMLEPPAVLAAGDADAVQGFRDQAASIQVIIDALRDERDADAQAADKATDPVNDRIVNWENQHVLHNCP